MDLGDSYAADKARLEWASGVREYHGPACGCDSCALRPPKRLRQENIDGFLHAISTLLHDVKLSGADLCIAQIISNLGDCYNMEDAEYVAYVWEACD